MHKCLFEISDYSELTCWNSCSSISDMCGYVNLLIIELLMMNLHVHDIYIYIYIYIYIWILNELWSIDEYWMLLLNCDGIHDYKLWLLLLLIISYHGLGMNYDWSCCCWIELLRRIEFWLLFKTCCFEKWF